MRLRTVSCEMNIALHAVSEAKLWSITSRWRLCRSGMSPGMWNENIWRLPSSAMMRLEHRQQAGLINWCARMQAAQGIVGDEERDFSSAVVAPETHGMPRGIIAAALVCEVQRHVRPPSAGGSVVSLPSSKSSCSYYARYSLFETARCTLMREISTALAMAVGP